MSDKVIASERLWNLLGYTVKESEKCWPNRLGKNGTWMYRRDQLNPH